jgi:hypothetical protein
MQSKVHPKKKPVQNTIESLKDLGSPSRLIDQILGQYESNRDVNFEQEKETSTASPRQEFTVFNSQEHEDQRKIEQQVTELASIAQKEADRAKRALGEQVVKIEEAKKQVINLPEKTGVYHILLFERIIEFFRTLALKVGESNTWLEAMTSRKAKRGSLFAARSKKQGTAYSLSQELQVSRSVQ